MPPARVIDFDRAQGPVRKILDINDEMTKFQVDAMNWLARPDTGEYSSIRQMMERHIENRVQQHNNELLNKIHFMETGEVRDESIADQLCYLPRDERSKNRAIQQLLTYRIDLGYVLYGLDGFSQHDQLSDLNDAQFLEVYNRVLLQLRALRLPDPLPS